MTPALAITNACRAHQGPRAVVRGVSRRGGPDDTEQLQARIATLEQQAVDLELQLQDRDDDLAAARAANRELTAQLNRSAPPGLLE